MLKSRGQVMADEGVGPLIMGGLLLFTCLNGSFHILMDAKKSITGVWVYV